MNFICLSIKSVTYAQKAAEILRKRGMQTYIARRTGTGSGCMWCVKIFEKDLERADFILKEACIAYDIFR